MKITDALLMKLTEQIIDMRKYIILKNGERLECFEPKTELNRVIEMIQHLESLMDRSVQHSPYTIGVEE